MVTRGISRGARKLARTPSLSKKKKNNKPFSHSDEEKQPLKRSNLLLHGLFGIFFIEGLNFQLSCLPL